MPSIFRSVFIFACFVVTICHWDDLPKAAEAQPLAAVAPKDAAGPPAPPSNATPTPAAVPVKPAPMPVQAAKPVPAKPAPVPVKPAAKPTDPTVVTIRASDNKTVEKALAIPNAELERLKINHIREITPEQMKLYKAFAQTAKPLTWDAIAKLEIEALVKAKMDPNMARATVEKAIQALKESGVAGPVRIPWGN